MNNRGSFFSELTRSRRGRFKFTCQMWWSFCCRYVTVGLEVFRRFSARLDRVRMWNWGRFIFTENSNSSQMPSCPDENRLQFFWGGTVPPVAEGLRFFLACLHLLNVKGIEVWRSHSASCHPKPCCVLCIVQDIELCSKLPSKSKNELALNPLGCAMNDKSYTMTMTFNH